LIELDYKLPKWLHFVPVDFEKDDAWLRHLVANSFDLAKPAVIASTGVSMYLTKEAIASTLRQVATLASDSTFAMTFPIASNPDKAS
jgi:O-methyltransferase involved in polyketide biosynthesis